MKAASTAALATGGPREGSRLPKAALGRECGAHGGGMVPVGANPNHVDLVVRGLLSHRVLRPPGPLGDAAHAAT